MSPKKKGGHDQKYVFYLARAHSQSHFPPFQGKAVTGSLGLSLTCCLARWAVSKGKKTELAGRTYPITTLERTGLVQVTSVIFRGPWLRRRVGRKRDKAGV